MLIIPKNHMCILLKMAVSKVKQKLWRKDCMLEAVKSIEDDGKGLREAAHIYNVPVETL